MCSYSKDVATRVWPVLVILERLLFLMKSGLSFSIVKVHLVPRMSCSTWMVIVIAHPLVKLFPKGLLPVYPPICKSPSVWDLNLTLPRLMDDLLESIPDQDNVSFIPGHFLSELFSKPTSWP